MSTYTQRVEALENNEKKKKQLFTVIIILLVVIFLGGMVIGANSILNTEGTYDPDAVLFTRPQDMKLTAAVATEEFRKAVINAADPECVKLSVSTYPEISDDSIKISSGREELLTQIKYVKPKILENVKNYYENYEGHFGENFLSHVIPADFTADDLLSVSAVRGRLNGEGELENYDTVYYTFDFRPIEYEEAKNSSFYDNFGMDISDSIIRSFTQDISSAAEITELKLTCDKFSITAETDAETGEIKNLCCTRGYSVAMTLSFVNDLEKLGTQTVSFDYFAKKYYSYTLAGLHLNTNKLSIEKGDIEALEAFRTADEDIDAVWTSSDPDTVSVDDRGYIKGEKVSDKPVIITSSFEYRGNTYTDSCTVYVRKPVEKIKVSQKELELTAGEKYTLKAEISPAKATIKDVLWFTEDENTATVDENGNITAVKAGTVKIFAVSADGYLRSSCVVTVKEAEKGSEVNG